MKVWSEAIYDTGISADGAYADIDGSGTNELSVTKEEANSILGLCIGACPTAITDAERTTPAVKVDSVSLGISGLEIPLPELAIMEPDSLSNYAPFDSVFKPLNIPPEKRDKDKIFDKKLKFQGKTMDDITAGYDFAVGLVFSDVEFDSEEFHMLRRALANRSQVPFGRSYFSKDTGKAHSGLSQVTLSTIAADSGFSMMVSHGVHIYPVGVAAADPISGIYQILGNQTDNQDPQNWVLPTFYSPVLGTVTERSPKVGMHRNWAAPFEINPQLAITYTPKSTILVDAGTAPDVVSSIELDY